MLGSIHVTSHIIMFDSDLVAPRQDGPGDQLLSSLSQTVTVVDNELVIAFTGLSLRLHVDASPGCGGLAWPAGQVIAHTCIVAL